MGAAAQARALDKVIWHRGHRDLSRPQRLDLRTVCAQIHAQNQLCTSLSHRSSWPEWPWAVFWGLLLSPVQMHKIWGRHGGRGGGRSRALGRKPGIWHSGDTGDRDLHASGFAQAWSWECSLGLPESPHRCSAIGVGYRMCSSPCQGPSQAHGAMSGLLHLCAMSHAYWAG